MTAVADGRKTVHVLRTRSGSTYRVDGSEVRRVAGAGGEQVYRLVSLGHRHLRYTDGLTIFVSSPLVAVDAL